MISTHRVLPGSCQYHLIAIPQEAQQTITSGGGARWKVGVLKIDRLFSFFGGSILGLRVTFCWLLILHMHFSGIFLWFLTYCFVFSSKVRIFQNIFFFVHWSLQMSLPLTPRRFCLSEVCDSVAEDNRLIGPASLCSSGNFLSVSKQKKSSPMLQRSRAWLGII